MSTREGYRRNYHSYTTTTSRPTRSEIAAATESMSLMVKTTKVFVAKIIESRGEGSFEVVVQGSRVIVRADLPRVSDATEYEVSRLISSNLEFLMMRIFGDKRFQIHHTVNVNERRLAYSY